MDAAHRAAFFAASCLHTPVDPLTRVPVALYERRSGRPWPGYEAQDMLDLNSSPKRNLDSAMYGDCEDSINLSKMQLSNQEYYLRLEELKNAHLETMAQLEKMYWNKLCLRDVQPLTNMLMKHRSAWEEGSLRSWNMNKSFSEPNLSRSFHSDVSDLSDIERELEENNRLGFGDIWEEFSSEDFPYRAVSGSSKLQTLKKRRRRRKKAWSPKLTVPEPFQMTVREAKKKEQNMKSKTQIEIENNLLKKQLEDEAECQKQFRANPVPAYSLIPLYHDLMRQNEERRKLVKDRRQEILLASQKPFRFIEREAQKKEMRRMQLKDLSAPDRKAKLFKANPVPKFVYSPEISERLKEEELYREIRIQMRSEELLHNSSFPNSRLGSKPRLPKCLIESKLSGYKPRAKASAPDFKTLHQKFQKQLQRQVNMKPVTVCEPFSLCTSNIPSKKGKILEDIQKDEEKLHETRWPYASPRCQPHARALTTTGSPLGCEEPTSPRITESTRKRLQAIRDSIEEKRKLEEEQRKNRAKQKQRTRKLQGLISVRAEANDPHQSLAQLYKSKLKTFRKQENQRMKEYLQELEEMEERVEKRPLLLERATQKNARMAAEKHYSVTLRELGLCEEFVLKKGRTSTDRLMRHHSSGGSEHSVGGGRSDDEIALEERQSDGEEEKPELQSAQSSEEEEEDEEEEEEKKTEADSGDDEKLEHQSAQSSEEEEEEEKTESDSGDDEQDQPEHESDNSGNRGVGKSRDNVELSD